MAKTPPAPPPVAVKPRVLSRYRPTPAVVAGAEPPADLAAAVAAATAVAAPPTSPDVLPQPAAAQAQVAPAADQQVGEGASGTYKFGTELQITPPAPPVSTKELAAEPSEKITEKQEPVIEPPDIAALELAAATESTQETRKQKGKNKKFEDDKSEKDPDGDGFTTHGQGVRPMAPSVPVRIAAPSQRATPPRPPKTHRQTPSERHAQKR